MTRLPTAFNLEWVRVPFSLVSLVLFVAAISPIAMSAQGSVIQQSPSNYVLNDGTGTLLGAVIYETPALVLPTSVYAYRLTVSEGRSIFVQTCVTRVEKDGSYICREVPVGQYVLLAAPAGRKFRYDQPSDISSNTIASYYLPFQSFTKSNLVTVAAKQHVMVDFRISPRATYGIRGQLQNGDSTRDISLFLVSDSGYTLRLPNLSLGANAGNFGFDALPGGRYLVRGQHFVNGRKQVAAEDVTLPQRTNVVTELRYPELHTVTFQMDGLGNDEGMPKFSLVDINSGDRYTFAETRTTKTASLPGIPSGKYRAELEGDKSRCIELESRISVGGTVDQVINLSDGSRDILLSGLYKQHCVTMKGRLRDGKPGDVIVADGSYHFLAGLRTDDSGTFAFTGLLPGDYTVFAWRTTSAVPFNDPQYLAGVCDRECRVALSSDDSDEDSVQVDIQPEAAP